MGIRDDRMTLFNTAKPVKKDNDFKVIGRIYVANIPTEIVDDGYGVKLYKCIRCGNLFCTKHDILKHYRNYEAIEFTRSVKNEWKRNKV